jgi:hypothetical protein
MNKQIKIPKSKFATEDEEAKITQKQEELRRKLLNGKLILLIYIPKKIKNAMLTEILYGFRKH